MSSDAYRKLKSFCVYVLVLLSLELDKLEGDNTVNMLLCFLKIIVCGFDYNIYNLSKTNYAIDVSVVVSCKLADFVLHFDTFI